MPNYLFVFFAGIAIATGLDYLGLGFLKKTNKTNLVFGGFAFFSGIYYLLYAFPELSLIRLFFATGMFVFFPWYFAFESGYIRPRILWLITGLGVGYYVTVLLRQYFGLPDFHLFFSYSVYVCSAIYALRCVRELMYVRSLPVWPFLIVTLYYIVFILEEFAFDVFGSELPWRGIISFTYLDLFPLIIIGMKLTLLVRDQLVKSNLEKAVDIYKSNVDLILNQAERFVMSLNRDGDIRFANPYLLEFFSSDNEVIQNNFLEFIPAEAKNEFQDKVLNNESLSGNLITELHTPKAVLAVAWSFVKLKQGTDNDKNIVILLFGANITEQKKIQADLENANRSLKILKEKLHSENIQLRNEQYNRIEQESLIGNSPKFNYVMNRVADVAHLDVPVLLMGETGVGKEVIANAIHRKSQRSESPFIRVNCAAIPHDLLESELFGYEKGAFTGADRLKKGMFELADKGTLFLDEIGDLPLPMQPKLLRAIQEGEIYRLGGEKPVSVDVRILAATNLNLEREVEKGLFRLDLYYRINVFPITIPPLRKRTEDIPLLINAFVAEFCEKYAKDIQQISESLLENLVNYSWPGNIRQLRNVIERAVISSSESVLKLASPLPALSPDAPDAPLNKPDTPTFGSLEMFERDYITKVLNHCNWKISGKAGAAEILQLPPSTLRSKMKKLGIRTPVV